MIFFPLWVSRIWPIFRNILLVAFFHAIYSTYLSGGEVQRAAKVDVELHW